MNYIKLQNEKLDIGLIQELVCDESCGAISLFVGTTRDNFNNKKVICLEYEAYEPMAVKVLHKICDDIRTKWTDVKNIAIYHRLGIVPVKEASVVIAISCPHRSSSIQSLQYAIDELKRTVPIWKKENYENDTKNNDCDNSSISSRIKIMKKSKLNITELCNIESFTSLPKNFIQINANEDELSRRIQCFIERKREENDINNILDFIPSSVSKNYENVDNSSNNENTYDDEKYETCARVSSSVKRQLDSKGHLRVNRIKNEYGPQTVSDYTCALDKLTKGHNQNLNQKLKENMTIDIKPLPIGVSERLEKIENFLNLSIPVSKDIYQRIKEIEDKLKYLETVSPEYKHFAESQKLLNDNTQKRKYSVQDLDNYISIFKTKK